MTNGEEKQNQGSVKSYDKLTYKNLIQKLIANCLEVVDNPYAPLQSVEHNVSSLKNALNFNQGSLKFKDEMDIKRKELDDEYDRWYARYHREENRRKWGNPFFAKPEIEKHKRKYWEDLFDFIQGMLGRYEALMEPRDYIQEGTVATKVDEEQVDEEQVDEEQINE